MPVHINKSIVFIDLPKRTADVYVSVIFRHGYYHESDKRFGLGHLFEHYLADRIEENTGNREIFGSIGNTDMRLSMKTKKGSLQKHISGLLETIFEEPIDNKNLLNKERARIRIELSEKQTQFGVWLHQQTKELLVRYPAAMKRPHHQQQGVVGKMTLENLRAFRKRLVGKSTPVLVVGAYGLSGETKKNIREKWQQYVSLTAGQLPVPKEATFKRPQQRTKRHPSIDSGYEHVTLAFPGLTLRDSLSDRLALGFFCRELSTRLQRALGALGVYRADYEYALGHTFGYIRFYSYVPRGTLGTYTQTFFDEIKNMLLDPDIIKELREFKRTRKQRLTRMWQSNLGRMEWIEDDSTDFGFFYTLEEVLSVLESLKQSDLRMSAEKIVTPDKLFLLRVLPK